MRLVARLGMLQITNVLRFIGIQGHAVVLEYQSPAAGEPVVSPLPPVVQVVTHRGGPAVVQALDLRAFTALAARHDVVVSMSVAVGDTVAEDMTLLEVRGVGRPIPERRLRRCVLLGSERTFEQDPKYAIRLLVDVAIRALSPAVNDPTTAVQALDQIEDLLIRIGRCRLAPGLAHDAGGRVRLVYPSPSWDDFIVLAFDEIRYCGASSIQVMRRMRALIPGVMDHVPAERRPSLQRYLGRVDAGIARTFDDDDDRRDASQEDRQGLGLSGERRSA